MSDETAHRRAHDQPGTTSESSVELTLDLDGTGESDVSTGVPLLRPHARARSPSTRSSTSRSRPPATSTSTRTTPSRTSPSCSVDALREALGDKRGISRFGDATVPLDEALVQAVVDVAGRPYVVHEGEPEGQQYHLIGGHFTGSMTRHVLRDPRPPRRHLRCTCACSSGRDPHHIVEAQFKAVARALRAAVARDPRVAGIPSAKGSL